MICMAFLGAARFCFDATSLMTITLNRLPWEFPIVSNTSSGLARRATMCPGNSLLLDSPSMPPT